MPVMPNKFVQRNRAFETGQARQLAFVPNGNLETTREQAMWDHEDGKRKGTRATLRTMVVARNPNLAGYGPVDSQSLRLTFGSVPGVCLSRHPAWLFERALSIDERYSCLPSLGFPFHGHYPI